jgi:hypothetical protein
LIFNYLLSRLRPLSPSGAAVTSTAGFALRCLVNQKVDMGEARERVSLPVREDLDRQRH